MKKSLKLNSTLELQQDGKFKKKGFKLKLKWKETKTTNN